MNWLMKRDITLVLTGF